MNPQEDIRQPRPQAGTRDPRIVADQIADELRTALVEDLIGLYLHGSATLGGFHWDRSDIDLLAVSARPLSNTEFHEIGRRLIALDVPANGLEFSLMTFEEVRALRVDMPRFQLHLATRGWDRTEKLRDGRGHPGDPDLILHAFACREAGEAIVGPPPDELFPAIPPARVLRKMLDELDWAEQHAPPPEYAVLTACRAWYYLEKGTICSKIEAGEWAKDRLEDRLAVESVLARQRGDLTVGLDWNSAICFLQKIRRRLEGGST